MIHVTTAEAQVRLADLLTKAEAGDAIEIHADDGRTFHLVANPLVDITDDFSVPLEDLRACWE